MYGGVCNVCVRRAVVARTHRKKRDVCATQAGSLYWNEAGMCPGINGFTKYAPIADWELDGAYMAVFAMCAFGGLSWLAHIAKTRCMRHPSGRTFGYEAGMCSGIHGLTMS